MKKDHRIGNKYRETHGLTSSPEFYIWRTMKSRCSNPKRPEYHRYGGRGIRVCDEWIDSFETFYKDMGPRPNQTHQIDRIDNDGNYCKSNCRWADSATNSNNRSTNKFITHNNQTLTESQWCEKLGMSRGSISKRIKSGWSIQAAIETSALSREERIRVTKTLRHEA